MSVDPPLAGYAARRLRLAVEGRVATIMLDRPERKNPLTFDSYAEMAAIFRAAARDGAVKVFVVTGAGGNFCSGGDMCEIIGPLLQRDTKRLTDFTALTGELVKAMRACPQPIVAAVDGVAADAGEPLPEPTFEAWQAATGLKLMDGIGSTEMLHIFIAAREEEIRPGATGRPVPGYEAKVLDENGREAPRGTIGRLAVRGPTGCRYLADPRQTRYVQDGWNATGDTYLQDEDGYFWFQARSDDIIVSAGYNIAGPEVEEALLTHPAVRECAVVGAQDPERGQIVKAHVVLRDGHAPDAAMAKALQEHVKATIAPYKYPRAVEFLDALPRTETGKLQRFALRAHAAQGA